MSPVYEERDGFYYDDPEGNAVGPFPTRDLATVAYMRAQGCKTGNCED